MSLRSAHYQAARPGRAGQGTRLARVLAAGMARTVDTEGVPFSPEELKAQIAQMQKNPKKAAPAKAAAAAAGVTSPGDLTNEQKAAQLSNAKMMSLADLLPKPEPGNAGAGNDAWDDDDVHYAQKVADDKAKEAQQDTVTNTQDTEPPAPPTPEQLEEDKKMQQAKANMVMPLFDQVKAKSGYVSSDVDSDSDDEPSPRPPNPGEPGPPPKEPESPKSPSLKAAGNAVLAAQKLQADTPKGTLPLWKDPTKSMEEQLKALAAMRVSAEPVTPPTAPAPAAPPPPPPNKPKPKPPRPPQPGEPGPPPKPYTPAPAPEPATAPQPKEPESPKTPAQNQTAFLKQLTAGAKGLKPAPAPPQAPPPQPQKRTRKSIVAMVPVRQPRADDDEANRKLQELLEMLRMA